MQMRLIQAFLFCAFSLCVSAFAAETPLKEIRTAPDTLSFGKAHIQGICCDNDAVYIVFNNSIFKIDWKGNLLKSTEAVEHSGDPCLANGHLFIAMSNGEGYGVYEYDTDLNLLDKKQLEKAPASDGIAYMNGHFFLGGPSAGNVPHLENRVLEYDTQFNLVKEHIINYGAETLYGTQSITSWNDSLFMAFYNPEGVTDRTIQTDNEMNVLNKFPLFTGNGIDLLPPPMQGENPRFIVAATAYTEDRKPIAVLRFYELRNTESGKSLVDITEESDE